MADTHAPESRATERTDLLIDGMTCASCAARIEKQLNGVEGVTATVNFATERVQVHHEPHVEPAELIAQVEALGYGARVPTPAGAHAAHAAHDAGADDPHAHHGAVPGADETRGPARPRARWSTALTVPVVAAVDDPGPAVRRLAVAVAHARRAGGHLGGMAVPPGDVGEPAPRRRHDGHAHLGRHARRLRLVALRPVHRDGRRDRHDPRLLAHGRARERRRPDLPRGRGRRDRVHPRRALRRGPGQAPLRRRAAGAARARRQGRRGPPRRRRGHASRSSSSPSATGSSCARARRSPPTAPSSRAPRPSTPRCSPASPCRSRSARATPSPGPPSTPAGASSCEATRVGLGHRARADRPAGRGRPDGQGPGPAAGRPGVRRLRAGRHRPRRRDPRVLAHGRRHGQRHRRRSPPPSPC